MADSYQAVYDATRSRISNGDVGQAVSDAVRSLGLDFHAQQTAYRAQLAVEQVSEAMLRPSVIYRPTLKMDGDQWCALYGENIQIGVCGFGATPAAAMEAFDRAFVTATPRKDGLVNE